MLILLDKFLLGFRCCFSRTAAFHWFVIIIMGLVIRFDHQGVTSFIRSRTKKENEDRNNQFEYINKMIIKFAKRRMPAISVDTKKKEPIGNFKNPGTRYKREADLTNDHNFLTYGGVKGKRELKVKAFYANF